MSVSLRFSVFTIFLNIQIIKKNQVPAKDDISWLVKPQTPIRRADLTGALAPQAKVCCEF